MSERLAPEPAARRTVATYGDYASAQRAVDFLSDEGFAVEHVSIVGRDLRFEERVTGRVTTGRATLDSAWQGALIGILFALLFGIFFATAPAFLGLLIYGLVVGAIFGAIFGALSHAAQGGRRDFGAVSGMRADRYEVMVDEPVAEDARSLLERLPATAR